ncbi:MAG: FKBP-type peptidyl-prolyl cis-trans isomerase SlyD [Planctomycetota bacterium]|jgi:FKBP-type peptidyl-prolyl cis-trans isomerase SlyD
MEIKKNHVVQFHYQLKEDGKLLEDSRSGEPMAYLHGANNLFAKMENEMQGKTAGDILVVTLAPEDAYGLRLDNSIQRISRKHIVSKGKLSPGMNITVNTDQGHRQVVVSKAGKFVVDVDTNHPMAGKTLTFEIEIIDVREASAEELTHGHAHGAGGHHH